MSKRFILTPPPNLTGTLHQGHILNLVIQDFIIQYATRIYKININVLYGFDHAALYAEIIAKRGLPSGASSSEIIKQISHNEQAFKLNILTTLQQNGFSYLNKDQELFTYSTIAKNLVQDTIEKLKEDNLLQIKNRVCYIDTVDKTTIADLEVKDVPVKKKLYFIRYYIVDPAVDMPKYLLVATSRPETIEADICLAYNQDNEAYHQYKDVLVYNPITKAKMPLVTSKYISMDFGTGLVKITPSYSLADEKICEELNIKYEDTQYWYSSKSLLFSDKSVFSGHSVYNATDIAVNYLNSLPEQYIEEVQVYDSVTQVTERNNNQVTTLATKQYFIDMNRLVNESKHKIEDISIVGCKGHIDIKQFTENLKPWCVSRQNLYGHRLDANNVLDTWFSSGLYPAIALNTLNLTRQTKFIIITAYDIMFFWIYRMFYLSQFAIDIQSISAVVVHGIVCDSTGNKISKSKLNAQVSTFSSPIEYEEYRLFLLSHNLFAKRIILDDGKKILIHKFFNKLTHIINFCNKHNIKEHKEGDINHTDFMFRYFRDKLVYIFRAKESWNMDEILNNLENILASMNRLINFVKGELSGILIMKLDPNIEQDKKFLAAFVSMLIGLIEVFAPQTSLRLKELWSNNHIQSVNKYLDTINDMTDYRTIKTLELVLRVVDDKDYLDNLSSYMALSYNQLYRFDIKLKSYDVLYMIAKDIYVYFNIKLLDTTANSKINSVYQYISQQLEGQAIEVN